MVRSKAVFLLVACFSLLLVCGPGLAGTFDNATLDPRFGFSTVGNSVVTFSALNDKSFTVTSYEIRINYDEGVSPTIVSVSPGAAKAEVIQTASVRYIQLLWQNIPPGTKLEATINIASARKGEHTLIPSSIRYYNQKKRYTGACNTALIVFRNEVLPIESKPGESSIDVLWAPSSDPAAVGYRLYKRTSTTEYSSENALYVNGLSYIDTNVQSSVAYYYKVAAVDQAGNDLEVSPETAEMLLNTKVRTYDAPARQGIAIGDIDGNGIPDLVVADPSTGLRKRLGNRAHVYMNDNGSSRPDVTLHGETSDEKFGTAVILVDMNSDGYDDLVVGAPGYLNTDTGIVKSGKVYVYAGGPSFSPTPAQTFVGRDVYTCNYSGIYNYPEAFGEAIDVAGDINGDGFQDVVIGSSLGGPGRSGRVLFLLGGPGLATATAGVVGPNCGDQMGSSVASVGDVNGDNYDDVIALSFEHDRLPGQAYLIYGGPDQEMSGLVLPEDRTGYGKTVTGLDLNGDGFSDLAFGTQSLSYSVKVYLGSSIPDASADLNLGDPRSLTDTTFVASMGDLDGDGCEDLLSSTGGVDGAVIFMGHTSTDNVPDVVLPGLDVKDVRDADRDGLKEIVAVSQEGTISLHSVALFAGLPHITITSPQNYETVNTFDLAISGIVRGSITRLLVGGQETQIGPDGSFATRVPVVLGRNGIEIIAQGTDGRIAKRKLYGTYGVTPIAVRIVSPADGITVCESPIYIEGTLSQPTAKVRLDWAHSSVYATTTGNSFQTSVDLYNGLNTITARATDPYGNTASHAIRVTYNNQCNVPLVTFGSQPETIQAGQSSTLTWSSANATTAVIDNGIGTVALNGSLTVSPSQTTTYQITVTGPGGTATSSAAITVTAPPPPPAPAVTMSANPALIEAGQSSTLTWSSANATTAVIDNGIGAVALNGSLTVSPSQTTTYQITVTGPGGTATSSFRVCLNEKAVYSYGDPTPAEQAFLEAVNRARLNPHAEAARLGINLFEGVPQGAISDQPLQPLTFNAKLLQVAYLHAQDMIVNQYYSHTSQDGRSFFDRIAQSGYQTQIAAENLSSSFSSDPQDEVSTVLSLHDHLFVDAGIEGRVHRVNLLTATLKEMGVGFVPGSYEVYSHTYLLTCDFGLSSDPNPFLLGVVYDDSNSDGAYTAGEGIKNVQIAIQGSGAITATTSAGGYAIRLVPGSYIVRAKLSDGREASRQIALSDQNVKVDFVLTDFHFTAPSVAITSNPMTILPGGSSTLTWASANAASAAIDNGIGAVTANGSLTVSPSRDTTYTIVATGPGGSATASVTVSVSIPSSINLVITSPANGQSIMGTDVTVTGTVDNQSGNETGVTVNGVNAIVYGGSFTASNVPLEEGVFIITATATDRAGSTVERSVTVNAATTGDSLKIMALQSMGIAPFETILRIQANFPLQGTPAFTYQGPGTVEFLESPGENEYAIRITTTGLYTFTVEGRNEANNTYTNSVVVQAIDKTVLDQLLRAKWEGMKRALTAANISGALQYFSEGSRERYGAMLTALSATLPDIVSGMRDISFAYMDGDRFAVYRITRAEVLQGNPYQITYHIYFVRDSDGIWRLSWF